MTDDVRAELEEAIDAVINCSGCSGNLINAARAERA